MITDIPSSTEFEQSGIDFLNLAWETIIELLTHLDNVKIKEWDDDGQVSNEYWQASQRALSASLALTQQGFEFILKGKVAEISPFLLISGSPNEWPKGCEKLNTSFADFKTIEAQDLIRVHDTFANIRLSDEVKEQFQKLRKLRNSIIHTVNKNTRFTPQEIIQQIVWIANTLTSDKRWTDIRRGYLEKSPPFIAYGTDELRFALAHETDLVIREITPRQAKDLFGYNKRQRSYHCPDCLFHDEDHFPKLAQLRPNNPTSTQIYCLICNETYQIVRKDCGICKGNVFFESEDLCLSCIGRHR